MYLRSSVSGFFLSIEVPLRFILEVAQASRSLLSVHVQRPPGEETADPCGCGGPGVAPGFRNGWCQGPPGEPFGAHVLGFLLGGFLEVVEGRRGQL